MNEDRSRRRDRERWSGKDGVALVGLRTGVVGVNVL